MGSPMHIYDVQVMLDRALTSEEIAAFGALAVFDSPAKFTVGQVTAVAVAPDIAAAVAMLGDAVRAVVGPGHIKDARATRRDGHG